MAYKKITIPNFFFLFLQLFFRTYIRFKDLHKKLSQTKFNVYYTPSSNIYKIKFNVYDTPSTNIDKIKFYV